MIRILLCFLCFISASVSGAERFFVNIQGSTSQIESVKKRSEYRMTKNVDFCRGVQMPKVVSTWRCQASGKQSFCSIGYECAFVDKNFNRKSESLRTYRAMKAMPAITASYKIALSKTAKFAPKTTSVVAAKQIATKPMATLTPVATATLEKQEQDDFEDLLSDMEEAPPTTSESQTNDDVLAEVADIQESEQVESAQDDFVSSWDWLRLDGYLTQMKDESGTQTALEAGWRPRWKFAARWSLEARVGLSQRKPFAASEETAFSVMEMGAWLGRRMGNWNLSGGFGRQSWGGEGEIGAQTPTFLSFGLAYYWSDIKFYAIEAIEFQYLSLSDEASSSAMRLGFLIRF